MGDDSPAGIVAVEALVEALHGREELALALLDEAIVAMGPESPAGSLLRLTRLRLGDASGDSLRSLEEATGAGDELIWRIQLEHARVALAEGSRSAARSALNRALVAFRASAPALGILAKPLSGLISAAVARLDVAASAAPDSDSAPAARLDPATLVRLVQFGQRLAAESDPREVLRLVLNEAITLSGADRGFVVLRRDGDLEVALAENLDRSTVAEAALQLSRSLIDEVFKTAASIVLDLGGPPEPHERWSTLTDLSVSFAACVPMIGRKGVLGALYFDRRSTQKRDTTDRQLLALFATLAGAALDNANAHRHQAHELEAARALLERRSKGPSLPTRYGELVGVSPAMQAVYQRLETVAKSDLTVLILGETGTGKDVVARVCHERSGRRDAEFVALNCAGMTDTLLESELFGYERGAFTGADRARPGLFEIAHRGTIFLDEVGDMSPLMQAHLLRVLESGDIRRVGATVTNRVDVRVLAASNRAVEQQVVDGTFRRDLFYRLNVVRIDLPPLRARIEDIPLLIAELFARARPNGSAPRLDDAVLRRLQSYAWPGNVRELDNVVRRLAVLGVDPIEERHLPHDILELDRKSPRAGTLRDAMIEAIRAAIAAAPGNKTHAARILGIDRKTLRLRLRELDLE